jgi:hypothetical protein
MLFASLAINIKNQADGTAPLAGGVSKLVGESMYVLGLPFAFKDMIPGTVKIFTGDNDLTTSLTTNINKGILKVTPQFFQDRAVIQTALTIAERSPTSFPNTDELRLAAIKFLDEAKSSSVSQALSLARYSSDPNVISNLLKELNKAKATGAVRLGGGIFSLADIGIGIGSIIEGSRNIETTGGKLSVASGSASIVAGVMGAVAILATNPVTVMAAAALAVAFTIAGAFLGFFSAPKKSGMTPHPVYGLTSDGGWDFGSPTDYGAGTS